MKKLFNLLFTLLASILVMAQNPPYALIATVNDNDVNLLWEEPFEGQLTELSYTDGINFTGLSIASTEPFSIGARFTPEQLNGFANFSIIQVEYFLFEEVSSLSVKIYEGAEGNGLIYEQEFFDFVPEAWNLFYLDTPPAIEASQDLYITVELQQNDDYSFPVGLDMGPAVTGYGDLINFQGVWESLTDYGFNNNISIRAFISDYNGNRAQLNNDPIIYYFPSNSEGELAIKQGVPVPAPQRENRSRELPDGYNIYRNGDLIGSATSLSYEDLNVDNSIYTYGVSAMYGSDESAQVQTVVQVGSPDFMILPETFIDTFPAGNIVTRPIEIVNNGNIELIWSAWADNYDITLSQNQGSIAPGESQLVDVQFSTYYYNPGTYYESIVFTTNDAAFPEYEYALQFTTISAPGFYMYTNELEFGDVLLNQPAIKQLIVANGGYEELVLSNFTSDSPYFEAVSDELVIPAQQSAYLQFVFTPDAVEDYEATITFNTNDPLNEEAEVILTGSGIVPAPIYLFGEVIDNSDVQLEWADVSGDQGNWLSYCSDDYYYSVGTGDGATFEIAIGWPAGSLNNFDGQSIANVAFYPTSELTTYTIKVYGGDSLSTLIYSQPITEYISNQWNVVGLNTPVGINADEAIYVALEINQSANEFAAAIDMGSAVPGLSDLINIYGEWQSTTEFGFDNNWLIKAFVVDTENTMTPLPVPVAQRENHNAGLSLQQHTFEGLHADFPHYTAAERTMAFTGYNVYRNGALIEELTSENNYLDDNIGLGTFEYGVTAVYAEGESNPVTRTVQVGSPVLVLSPAVITDSIEGGVEVKTYDIDFSNEGLIDLEWEFETLPDGISFSANGGTIAPGASETVTLTFDATAMFPGPRNLVINIPTNNLNQPLTSLAINMIVTGDGGLLFSETLVDFGMVNINEQITKTVQVVNNSAVPAFIYTGSDTYFFQPYIDNYHLLPGDSAMITISFLGNEVGAYEANLLISSHFDYELVEYSIPMYAFVSLPSPASLTGELSGDTVNLNWYPPGVNPLMLQYGNGGVQTAIGGPENFEVAAKYETDLLQYYAGKTVTHIGFYTWDDIPEFTLKVYTGDDANTLVLEQPVESVTAMTWNDIELSSPIAIDPEITLWLGYQITSEPYMYAIGADFGPAVAGKGDLYKLPGEEWASLTDYGLPYNWNIRGWVSDGDSIAPLTYQDGIPVPETNTMIPNNLTLEKGPFSFDHNQRAANATFVGYKVYRNGETLTAQPIAETNWTDLLEAPGGFLYEVTSVFDIGESMPASIFISNDSTINMPEGWEFVPTNFMHNIYIPVEAAVRSGLEMESGDIMGVFYHENGVPYCAGAVAYQNGQLMITAYGDDPMTPEKEGFVFGETIYWKAYLQDQEIAYDLNVTYDAAMPQHDGHFHMGGLSMLATMETVILDLDETLAASVRIYPNPNTGSFTLQGLQAGDQVSIMDATGRLIDRFEATDITFNISVEAKGLLILSFQRADQITHQKILVQ
ncbi:MAG: choice-of-anchor D domain-containing protein [Bacteroidetes bacterium]|jgi:hypothetical protein|nr:choice-of-anchor D domain-containing protein [Bacteroidota bacterium]